MAYIISLKALIFTLQWINIGFFLILFGCFQVQLYKRIFAPILEKRTWEIL